MGPKKVIIVGGGVGGLTLAAKLDNKKFNVTIYEKNEKCGGRCSILHKNGFSFEQGAILYLFDDIYKKVFTDLGLKDFEKKIGFATYDKTYHRLFLADENEITYSKNISALGKKIDEFEKCSDGEVKLQRFYDECKRIENFVFENVFYKTYNTPWEVFRSLFWVDFSTFCTNLKNMWTGLRYKMYCLVNKYFKSDQVCQALTFQSLYFGISPYTGSSLFSILAAYEIATGLKYPKNGMVSIVHALEERAKVNNAHIITGKGVKKIVLDNSNKATGVELDDGTFVDADVVVSNADLTYTYNELLKYKPGFTYDGKPDNSLRRKEQRALDKYAVELTKKDHVPSTITFFWGMNRQINGLVAHNTFLPTDYKKLFEDINVNRKIPDEPAFFIHIANRMDPNMAPGGKDALTVIVPIGEMASEQGVKGDFEDKVAIVKKKVIKRLEERLKIDDFAKDILTEIEPQTPGKWKTDFNCWEGNILGTTHSLTNLLCFRANQKCEQLSNVYFVGASTQPGAGVPLVMCSALSLAPKIENDHGSSLSS